MSSSSENRLFCCFLSLLLAGTGQAAAQSRDFRQAPKALSALKKGQQAQSQGNLTQAIHFYRAAATTGNPEGYFRISACSPPARARFATPAWPTPTWPWRSALATSRPPATTTAGSAMP